MNEGLKPLRERRREFEKDKGGVEKILVKAAEHARSIAREVLMDTMKAMSIR
jgi:hypothetical protein